MQISIKKRGELGTFIGLVLLLLLWVIGVYFENRLIIWTTPFFMNLVVILYSIRDISNRIGLMLFMITMIILNTGFFFIRIINNEELYTVWLIDFVPSFKQEVDASFLFLLASIFPFIGLWISESIIKSSIKEKKGRGETIWNINALKKASLVVFYIGLICYLAETIEQVTFVQAFGYNEKFISNIRNMPDIIYRLEKLMWPGFFVFCACMPDKKAFRFNSFILLAVSALSLLAGSRGRFVLNLLIILFYMVFRQNYCNDNDEWIGKRLWIMVAFLLPAFAFVIVGIQYWRHGESMTLKISEIFESFMGNTSGLLVLDELNYQEKLPKQNYVFGPLLFYLKNNILGGVIGTREIVGQTREFALNGNNYAASLTYLIAPGSYLSGGGFGSNFIAEAFHDMSYFGVVVFGIIYGWILGKSTYFLKNNYGKKPFMTAIVLLMIQSILYAPRSSAILFLTDSIFSIWNWISFGIIYVLYYFFRRSLNGISLRREIK